MEEKQKLLSAGALPGGGNDLPKPKEREHVHFWEVMTGNVARGPGPRQVCWTSPEMGPCADYRKSILETHACRRI